MKLKRKLIMSLLGGAMLALPMTAPAFAEPRLQHRFKLHHSRSIGGGIITKATGTGTPITVGIRDTTSTAASGMPATAHAVSRTRCGATGARGIRRRPMM